MAAGSSGQPALVSFLLARAAEREEDADSWHRGDCTSVAEHAPPFAACDCGVPARVRAEVRAVREVVELHTPTERAGLHLCPVCVSWEVWVCQEPGEALPLDEAPCDTARRLAAPHADHPDYRAEVWAP